MGRGALWKLLWSAMAVLAAGGAVLAHGGRFSTRLDLLTHFAPLYVAAGIAAAVAELLWRRKPTILAASLAAIVAGGGLIAPDFIRKAPRADAPSGPVIKLVQFNAWRHNQRLEEIVAWLVAEKPDLVLIEEASPQLRDAVLARTGWNVVGRKTTVMIFSPHELVGKGVRPTVATEGAPTWVNARVVGPWGAIPVVAVHYHWPTQDLDDRQGPVIAEVVRAVGPDRLLLAGDFNSTPWSFARRREDAAFALQRITRGTFSWPATVAGRDWPVPLLPIDHVYAGSGWRVLSLDRGPRLGSDHYPLVVRLALVTPTPGRATVP